MKVGYGMKEDMDRTSPGGEAWESFSQLIRLLEKKASLLDSIISITGEQLEAIAEDTIERFQASIDKRQQIMNQIDLLDKEFAGVFDKALRSLGVSRLQDAVILPPNAGRLKEVTADVTAKLEKLQEMDRASRRKAEELMTQLKGKMKEINAGKRMTRGYYPKPLQSPSYFLDKKIGK